MTVSIRNVTSNWNKHEFRHISLVSFGGTRRRLYSYRNRFYVGYEKLRAFLSFQKPMRILFGDDPQVSALIERGIRRHSRHHVEFGPITAESFQNFDLVVPVSISDFKRIRQWPQAQIKSPIPFPSAACLDLCDDKYAFNEWLCKSGFGAYVPRIGAGLEKPYILKKRVGLWGRECHVIRDSADEAALRRELNSPEYFCQEIVRGRREFATHVLFMDGRVVKSLNIMYEFESEMPVKGKDVILTKVIHRCPFLNCFSDILRSIEFQGLCCVNYKVVEGHLFILEINPRFGGSLAPYFFSFLRHLYRRPRGLDRH